MIVYIQRLSYLLPLFFMFVISEIGSCDYEYDNSVIWLLT